MGTCALHAVIGQNSARRKELEPSRLLSETTGPQPSVAFHVVFLTTEVTKRGVWCKRSAAFFTHRAATVLGLTRYRRAREGVAHVPATRGRVAPA